MKKWTGPVLFFAICVAVSHGFTLTQTPGFIMTRAMERIAESGFGLHQFRLSPRITPQTQQVVRSSPDLAYSICRFDFSQAAGPITVTMGAYDGYSSLSFFDDQTNNFAVIRGAGETRDVTLLPPGTRRPDALTASSDTGVILIRRLAPEPADYRRAAAAAAYDGCAA